MILSLVKSIVKLLVRKMEQSSLMVKGKTTFIKSNFLNLKVRMLNVLCQWTMSSGPGTDDWDMLV